MQKEILIYGLAKGETQDYMEDMLACFKDDRNTVSNIEKVKQAASAQGFHSFRVASYNGESPNFTGTVAIRVNT